MHLALDIGNTSVTYGLYRKNKLAAFGSCSFIDIPKKINKWISGGVKSHFYIIASSVVPDNTHYLKKITKRNPKLRLLIAGEDLKIPFRHNYNSGNALGVDRKVTMFGALQLYRPPLLVIDFGTAITFDYLSPKGVFEGGMIIPGPELAFQTLLRRAALLPKKARLPTRRSRFAGRSTSECLTSGILEGYGAMTDGLVDRFKRFSGGRIKVIATGGFSRTLKRYARSLKTVNPRLSVHSLHLLFLRSAKAS